tara:strand:+ start:56 stop:457 length:402 start_codon:yes stop_codon:yes gene_type:complete
MSTLAVGTVKSVSSTAPTIQNTSGTEIGRFVRAWCRFNGTGTVTINDSFNCSSITDNGTGNYNVNFTNQFANSNYAYAMGYTAPVNSGQSPQMHTICSSQGAGTDSINVAIFHPQQSASFGRANDSRIGVIIC